MEIKKFKITIADGVKSIHNSLTQQQIIDLYESRIEDYINKLREKNLNKGRFIINGFSDVIVDLTTNTINITEYGCRFENIKKPIRKKNTFEDIQIATFEGIPFYVTNITYLLIKNQFRNFKDFENSFFIDSFISLDPDVTDFINDVINKEQLSILEEIPYSKSPKIKFIIEYDNSENSGPYIILDIQIEEIELLYVEDVYELGSRFSKFQYRGEYYYINSKIMHILNHYDYFYPIPEIVCKFNILYIISQIEINKTKLKRINIFQFLNFESIRYECNIDKEDYYDIINLILTIDNKDFTNKINKMFKIDFWCVFTEILYGTYIEIGCKNLILNEDYLFSSHLIDFDDEDYPEMFDEDLEKLYENSKNKFFEKYFNEKIQSKYEKEKEVEKNKNEN